MRKLSATYIFPGNKPPLKNGIVICEDDGTIVEIIDTGGKIKEIPFLEYYTGILVPGFINAHCHLELSHLNGLIEDRKGLGNFIGEINRLRNENEACIEKKINLADLQLYSEGIVATGDISNSSLSLKTKIQSNIFYHTFVEAYGFHPSRADKAFSIALFIEEIFHENGLTASVVPHSPYSVSSTLFNKIKRKAFREKSIISIHNQESRDEALFFSEGKGPVADHLQNNLGIDISHWQPSGKSSLMSFLPFIPTENQLLLVHNTYTSSEDLEKLLNIRSKENTFFVLCPNSNLYIENKLPPVPLFRERNLNICIGTDSLASNQKLSVLKEMLTLQQNFNTSVEELILWACYNGARSLKIENIYGSFEKGKKPGINLLTGIDLQNLKLTTKSKVTRLIKNDH